MAKGFFLLVALWGVQASGLRLADGGLDPKAFLRALDREMRVLARESRAAVRAAEASPRPKPRLRRMLRGLLSGLSGGRSKSHARHGSGDPVACCIKQDKNKSYFTEVEDNTCSGKRFYYEFEHSDQVCKMDEVFLAFIKQAVPEVDPGEAEAEAMAKHFADFIRKEKYKPQRKVSSSPELQAKTANLARDMAFCTAVSEMPGMPPEQKRRILEDKLTQLKQKGGEVTNEKKNSGKFDTRGGNTPVKKTPAQQSVEDLKNIINALETGQQPKTGQQPNLGKPTKAKTPQSSDTRGKAKLGPAKNTDQQPTEGEAPQSSDERGKANLGPAKSNGEPTLKNMPAKSGTTPGAQEIGKTPDLVEEDGTTPTTPNKPNMEAPKLSQKQILAEMLKGTKDPQEKKRISKVMKQLAEQEAHNIREKKYHQDLEEENAKRKAEKEAKVEAERLERVKKRRLLEKCCFKEIQEGKKGKGYKFEVKDSTCDEGSRQLPKKTYSGLRRKYLIQRGCSREAVEGLFKDLRQFLKKGDFDPITAADIYLEGLIRTHGNMGMDVDEAITRSAIKGPKKVDEVKEVKPVRHVAQVVGDMAFFEDLRRAGRERFFKAAREGQMLSEYCDIEEWIDEVVDAEPQKEAFRLAVDDLLQKYQTEKKTWSGGDACGREKTDACMRSICAAAKKPGEDDNRYYAKICCKKTGFLRPEE